MTAAFNHASLTYRFVSLRAHCEPDAAVDHKLQEARLGRWKNDTEGRVIAGNEVEVE